jgi:signal transduction histidine kinase
MAWQSATLPVVLTPHFYQRKSFIALLILAGAALLLAIHFMRLRLARQRAHLLQQLVEERTHQISEEKERTERALREAERHEQLAEEALARAEDANRAKSIFLATTSHELRTPLNAIIGFSDILIGRATHQLDPRFHRFLHNIHSSGGYLLGIINNILDLSKIEAGKMDLQPEPIALNETVSAVCAVMKGVTTLRKIRLDLRIPNDLPKFEADPIQMKQILYNLIANAVKFSPDNSSVTVSAKHLWPVDSPINENAIEIRVVDHGIGIDPKDHQLIFQEFRQVHESGTKRPEGTGLGLALVRRFVEMHGGTIRVESMPGEGATFIIVLPCRQPTTAAQSPETGTARLDGL